MKKSIFIVFIYIISIFNLMSQNTIDGKVFDFQNDQELPGANVFLQSDWSIGTTTNENGVFQLNIAKALKNDTIIVSYIGYRDKYIPVSDKNNQSITVQLEPFAELLGESVVTARRIIAEEFTIKQVKQMDIYLNPAAKADPLLAINAMPSSTTTDESASISLRGSRPDETGIYLNDVPVYDAIRFAQLNGVGTFSIFNTDVIERMHVFAGNPAIEYGNTASGLVSLQTNNNIPTDPLNTLAISLANFGGQTSRKIGENTSLIAFGNYQPSQIFTGLNQDAMPDLKDFHSGDLGLHVIHNLSNDIHLKIFNYSNLEGYQFNYRNPSYTGIFDMNKSRNYTIANFIKQNNNSEITVNGGYSISKENFKYSITDISIDKQDIYISANYQHFFNKLSIKTGTSIDYRENETYGSKPIFDYAQAIDHPHVNFNSFESYFLPEVFLYSKYNIAPNLILGTGIRKNIKVDDQPDYLSYQANLNYKPACTCLPARQGRKVTEKHNFNLSGGHYNKLSMPNARQYTITHYESNQLSLDYTYTSDNYEIQGAIFTKESTYDDKTNLVKGGEIYTKLNIKPFEFQFSFTTVDAKIKNGTSQYPSNFNFDYFIRSVVKYSLKDNFEISAIYIFRQGTYYLPVVNSIYIESIDEYSIEEYSPVYSSWNDAERLPDYHKIDLSISKYWVVNSELALVLYANASNLLNINNVKEVNYNNNYTESFNELYSRRTFYFGVSIIF